MDKDNKILLLKKPPKELGENIHFYIQIPSGGTRMYAYFEKWNRDYTDSVRFPHPSIESTNIFKLIEMVDEYMEKKLKESPDG